MKFTSLLVGVLLALTPALAYSAPSPDPALRQTVSASEAMATGPAEVAKGHVDIGPMIVDGTLTTALRDDTAKPPVWRRLDDVVVRVSDAALLDIPNDPQYQFLGLPGGKRVLVVPQTQSPEVIWVGWNTQHPSLASALSRGITLRYQKVVGPGRLHVFLQNGFDKPQPLWSSANAAEQDIWVDVNTHTPANWVFSEPGNYQVVFQVRGDAVDGKQLTSEAVVNFAVGDQASAAALRALPKPVARQASSTTSATPVAVPTQQASPAWVWPTVGGLAAVLVGLLWWFVRRQRLSANARRHIFEEKSGE